MNTAIAKIAEILTPNTIALSPEDRRSLAKMSDKTILFVEKSLDYVQTSPEFSPPYLDVEEMKIDMKAVNDLKSFYNPLSRILSNLDDTIMLSGSEAYTAALSYYQSVKQAAKIDIPGAKVIYEDLGKRFPGKIQTPVPPPEG